MSLCHAFIKLWPMSFDLLTSLWGEASRGREGLIQPQKCRNRRIHHYHENTDRGGSSKHPTFIIQSQLLTPHKCFHLVHSRESFGFSRAPHTPSGDAVVKWHCSKRFCWEQHLSFQMDGGPCPPCGVWFLISVSRQCCKLTRLQRTIYLSLQHSSGELLKGSNWGQSRKQWHGADNDTIQYSGLKMAVLSSRISSVEEYCDSNVKDKYSP